MFWVSPTSTLHLQPQLRKTMNRLYPVNLAELTSLGQAILAICIGKCLIGVTVFNLNLFNGISVVLGNGVLLTLPPVLIRLYYFKQCIHSKLLSKRRKGSVHFSSTLMSSFGLLSVLDYRWIYGTLDHCHHGYKLLYLLDCLWMDHHGLLCVYKPQCSNHIREEQQ